MEDLKYVREKSPRYFFHTHGPRAVEFQSEFSFMSCLLCWLSFLFANVHIPGNIHGHNARRNVYNITFC